MNEEVRDYNFRKTNRLSAVLMKIDDLEDTSKMLKVKTAQSLLSETKKLINSNVKRNIMKDNNNDSIYVMTLNLNPLEQNNFITKIQENYIEAGEMVIEKELLNEKKELKDMYLDGAINLIDKNHRDKYINAVNHISHLSKLKKVNALNTDAFEIVKDLRACLGYENKITSLKGV